MATRVREAAPARGICCEECISLVKLGGALLVLGMTAWANLLLMGLATAEAVGIWMLAAGGVELLHSLWTRRGRWRVLWGFHSICYLVAGYWFAHDARFTDGRSGAYAAIALGFSGAACAGTAMAEGGSGRQWMATSGLVSLVAAAIVAVSGAFGAFWLAGTILSIDLIYRGCMQILTGFTLRWDALAEQEQESSWDP